MKQTALITGASSGIGAAFADIFATDGFDLVLTARNQDKLLAQKIELEKKYKIAITVISKDLSVREAAGELFHEIREHGIQIDVLVNNAGYGDFNRFLDADLKKQVNMVDLNVVALLQMAYLYGNEMRMRGSGKILNVASIAGFCAGPYMSVYYATKGFVLSFSQALAEELRGTGIVVTALCPGPTATNFENAGNMSTSTLFNFFKTATAHDVAAFGYKALMAEKGIATYGLLGKALNVSVHLLPKCIVRKITMKTNGKPPSAHANGRA